MSQRKEQITQKDDGKGFQELRARYAEAMLRGIMDSETAFLSVLATDMEDVTGRIPGPQFLSEGHKSLTSGIALSTARALETLAQDMRTQLPSGSCVSWGLVIELYLSMALLGFPKDLVRHAAIASRNWFGAPEYTCKHYDRLSELILGTDQNGSSNRLPLLRKAGEETTMVTVKKELLFEALDFLRESCGL